MGDPLYLSVIVAVHNDEHVLGDTLDSIIRHLEPQPYDYEIIISDGSDNHESSTEIRKLVNSKRALCSSIRYYPSDLGTRKGSVVKSGMSKARGRYRLFMDSDNATPFEQVDRLLAEGEHAEVVLASRYVPGAKIVPRRSALRTLVSRGGNIVISRLLNLPYKDTRCGFKLFSERAGDEIFSRVTLPGFGFDDEALVLADRMGFKVVEVPVEWRDIETLYGIPSHVSPRDILMSFVELGRILSNLAHHRYLLERSSRGDSQRDERSGGRDNERGGSRKAA